MKQIFMYQIREYLAKGDAEGIDEYSDLYEIYLNGCIGYNNMENEDCIDYYLSRVYPDMFVEDSVQVKVLEILDDGTREVVANVYQENSDITLEYPDVLE
jgi:hypothetical protein